MNFFNGKSALIRLILAFGIMGLVLTIMGFVDLGKDIGGSYSDFNYMKLTDFREGDIIKGTITENLGQAAYIETTEYTFVVETDKYTSSGYYVIPFFSSIDAPVPDKLMLYHTGNKTQMDRLDTLEGETDSYYFGETDGTRTHVVVDRAEVVKMTEEEKQYFLSYIKEYIDWLYDGYGYDTSEIYDLYIQHIVPYVVKYNAGGGSWMLGVGVTILGIMAVVFVIYLIKSRSIDHQPQYTYVPPQSAGTNMPYQSGTGTPPPSPYQSTANVNAEVNKILNMPARSHDEINIVNTNRNVQIPRRNRLGLSDFQVQTNRRDTDQEAFAKIMGAVNLTPVRPNSYIGNTGSPQGAKGNFDRPMPPIEGMNEQENIYGSNVPKFDPNSRMARAPKGDSMPSVDPHSEANIDLSNGGTAIEDRAAQYRAVMPHNGDIPVVNPNRTNFDESFEQAMAAKVPEMPQAPEMPTAQAMPESDLSSLLVEQTDPSMRNGYVSGGHMMQEVDPYTETNVDISNGGIEREITPAPAPAPVEPAPAEPVYTEPAPSYTEQLPDFGDIDIPAVQDIPTVQDIPSVQDIPKMTEFPTVPDYSSSYARPEFPQAPSFPDTPKYDE